MKAAIINKYGGPEVFEIKEVPMPKLNNDQVLIKISYAGVNPVDTKTRKGNHKYILGSEFPIVLGYDLSGEVVEIGKNISKFKTGDLVYARTDVKYGKTYAQFGVTSEKTLSKVPEGIDLKEAAAIPLASITALQALRDKGKIKVNDKVLIIGAAGGVGHFAVQLVKSFGAKCYAVSSQRHKMLIDELSPDVFIDYTKSDFKKLNEKFDIIFDTIGNESFLTCRHLLTQKGIYITSLPRPKVLIHRFISLFTNGSVATLLMKSNSQDLDFIGSLIENKKLKVKIDKVFPLENITDAHEYIEKGRTEGKIIIKIPHDE